MNRKPNSCFIMEGNGDMNGDHDPHEVLPSPPEHQPKIIIIGAGIAGLAAGKYLQLEGFTDYTILESSDRIGGRIWTQHVDDEGHKAEMGANWIHGVKSNPIYKIADEHNLLTERELHLNSKNVYTTENREIIHEGTIKKVDFTYGILLSSCEDYFHGCAPQACDELDSVGSAMDDLIGQKLKNTAGEERTQLELVYHQRRLLECCISGCDRLYEVSLKQFGSYQELPGRHLEIPGGFNAILDIVRDGIPEDKIKLNSEVRCIYYGERCLTGKQRLPKGAETCPSDQVCVQMEDGELMYADHVILTVSLGVLKAACDRMFNPPLPMKKLEAIHHLGFGTVNKVILVFEEPLLQPPIRRLHLAWDPNIASHDNLKEKWFRKIYSLEVIHDNILVGWLSGTEALYLESLSEEQLYEDMRKMVEIFLPAQNIPKLVKVLKTNWGNYKHTRGSYSYVAVGSTQQDIINLKHPLTKTLHNNTKKPVVLFSGEATHPTFYSTTHGALLTGNREAARICKFWKPHEADSAKYANLGLSDTEATTEEENSTCTSSDDDDEFGGLCFM